MDGQFLPEETSPLSLRARYLNFIGGEWIAPLKQNYAPHVEPFGEKVLCEFARSSSEDMVFALGAAHSVSRNWRQSPISQRRLILQRIAAALEENATLLARISYEAQGGISFQENETQLSHAIGHFRYAAMGLAADQTEFFQTQQGVKVQFLPASYSLLVAAWTISKAILQGEPIVLKPDVTATVPVLALVDVISSRLPDGVVNLVSGYDRDLIAAVKLSNTDISINALKPACAPVGAKPAQVFFADVCDELDGFQMSAIESFCLFLHNQGADGFAPTRAFIHQDIYERFLSRVLSHLAKLDKQNRAPQSTWALHERTLSYVQIARNEGADLRYGGRCYEEGAEGYFMQPTVFEGENSMRVFQEPTGGPILAVAPFAGFDEAVFLVNDTSLPFSTGVWSREKATTSRFKAAVNCQFVWPNAFQTFPHHPAFSGYSNCAPQCAQSPISRYLAKELARAE